MWTPVKGALRVETWWPCMDGSFPTWLPWTDRADTALGSPSCLSLRPHQLAGSLSNVGAVP